MAENQTAKWTSTQAYVLSVICLLVGVAVGYLARGSASPQAGVGQVQASSAAAKGAAAQTPTPEQMRQMAESHSKAIPTMPTCSTGSATPTTTQSNFPTR